MSRQTYAYAVCLVAVIALLIAAPRLVSAYFEYREPLQSKQAASEPDLSSFEAFLSFMERTKSARDFDALTWPKDRGRSVYEAARDARVASVRFEARRSMISYGTLAAVADALLLTHLFLARRASTNAASQSAA